MIDPGALGLFALASAGIVVVPGPTVTVIVANSLRHGARAGLWNVVGTQLGLATMLAALAVGFGAIVDRLGGALEIVRIAGAVYLVWLGVSLWRANGGTLLEADPGPASLGPEAAGAGAASGERKGSMRGAREDVRAVRFVRQGFLVIWANPKALVFFGALIPQFVDAGAPAVPQLAVLGATFMVVGAALDGAYALAAGRAGRWLNRDRARAVERASGTFLVGGGLWLAASGARA